MQTFRSGEIARRAGVSVDTLRHYERRGLLPPPARRANGYRVYPAGAVERVLLIRRALAIGFSLDELTRILRARDSGHAPCVEVRELANRKLEEVNRRIEDLSAFRESLDRILRQWDTRLRKKNGAAAHLLESLPDPISQHSSPLRAIAFEHRKDRK